MKAKHTSVPYIPPQSIRKRKSTKIRKWEVTLTKVLDGGFPWPTFSMDWRKPDSSMQLEGAIAGLREKLVPAILM
jgi:hypothetical protein